MSDHSPTPSTRRLTVPDFQSTLPPFLSKNYPEEQRYMVEQINIMSQKLNWLVTITCALDDQVKKLEARVAELEEWRDASVDQVEVEEVVSWKKSITGGWRGVLFVGALLAGIIGFLVSAAKVADTFRSPASTSTPTVQLPPPVSPPPATPTQGSP